MRNLVIRDMQGEDDNRQLLNQIRMLLQEIVHSPVQETDIDIDILAAIDSLVHNANRDA